MSIKVVFSDESVSFDELNIGEICVEKTDGKPYTNSFLIKTPLEPFFGVNCNAREFDTEDQSSQGRLVKMDSWDQVYRVQFTSVELKVL